MGIRGGSQFHGTQEAARERRHAIIELFQRSARPLTKDDVWRLARPRMLQSQASYGVDTLQREGVLEVVDYGHRGRGAGRLTTYRLSAQLALPAPAEKSA